MSKSKLLSGHNKSDRSTHAVASLKCILFDIICASPVFFAFVYTARLGGYDVFERAPYNIIPPFPIYLADYSLGFSSRLLIGSVTRLFSYRLSLDTIYLICWVMVLLALVCVSLICGALIRRSVAEKNFLVFFICIIFAVNPLVSQEHYPAIGTYDTYWIILFFLLIMFFKGRGFAVASVFLCFVGVLVHYGFCFSLLPAVLSLHIYDFLNAEEKSGRILSGSSFFLTGGSCAAVLLYSFLFSNSHLKMTGDEFHDYLVSRLQLTGVQKVRLEKFYGERLMPFNFFEIYFFDNKTADGSVEQVSPGRYLELFFGYLKDSMSLKYYLEYAVALLPFALICAAVWIACAKMAKGAKKVPFVFFACIQAVIFIDCTFSTDLYRWISLLMISQTTLIYAMFQRNDETFLRCINSPFLKKTWVKIFLAACGAIYAVYLLRFGACLPRTFDA